MRIILSLTVAFVLFPVQRVCANSHDQPVELQDSVSSVQIPYPMSEQAQRAALTLLTDSAKSGWRLALASDNTNGMLDTLRAESKGYEPYFLQADFTGDRRPDFALALVKEGLFEVFFFPSKSKGYAPPQRIVQLDWLNLCGFFAKGRRLVIGEFYSDHLFSFSWNRSKQAMELEPEEPEQ